MTFPKPGEQKPAYIERCVSNSEMVGKFPDSAQRFAVCNSYWKEHHAKMETDKEIIHLLAKNKK